MLQAKRAAAVEVRSFIDGQWRDGDPRPRHNPANPSELVALAHAASANDAQDAVEAAAAAWRGFASMPAPDRGSVLYHAAAILDKRAEPIGRNLAREEGKTLGESVGEVRRAAAIFRFFAGQTVEPDGETYPSHSRHTLLYARREPLGAIAVITPWNFPIAIPAWKIAPALAYGNTVVWKPAEIVPLTSLALLQTLLEAGLPPGVLNLLIGSGSALGSHLLDGHHLRGVTFTGSNSVGRAVQQLATEQGLRVQLELGGKNPAVVLAEANIDQAAELVARGAFLSAGQKCTATSRVIVDRTVVDDFVSALGLRARSWRLGDPLDPQTQVGPLASKAQLDGFLRYADQSLRDGGTFNAGGTRDPELPGYFAQPTIVSGLPPTSPVVCEEIFAPFVTILEADGPDEALAIANDTPFGLSASVFTRDLNCALKFASGLEAGIVKINQESAGVEFHVPFGGQKDSSSGTREQGKVAREFFTQWKTVYIDPTSTT